MASGSRPLSLVAAFLFFGTALTAPATAATYENRYVNGQLFFIGTEGDLQVWVSVAKGSDF